MTTEYRPLLTADAVIAARDAGEVVECTAFLNDPIGMPDACKPNSGGWIVMPAYFDAGETLANGYRYRARPAGESLSGPLTMAATDTSRALDPADPRAAEIEALRAEVARLRVMYEAAHDLRVDAERRAARLEAELAHAHNTARNMMNPARRLRYDRDIASLAALGPGGGT